ncbi:amidase domain-containing protein [Paenibacillus wynnii]|uniref:Putative amidase domain-containing protein n=1 Tax=Paenibacillus wynnii TaxID=268407 RepID=A0A098MEV9_9BACL|nr:amidase domain-containing protein [Paenibacillus wynnii]KGE20077.1 hypothetical protein PWYN_12560 [Paenibacillus wynnii]
MKRVIGLSVVSLALLAGSQTIYAESGSVSKDTYQQDSNLQSSTFQYDLKQNSFKLSEANYIKAETIFKNKIYNSGLDYEPGSSEYSNYLNNYLWDIDGQLTKDRNFTQLVKYVLDYNKKHLATEGQLINPTLPQNNIGLDSLITPLAISYNRQQAVNYAYAWASAGSAKRNSTYSNRWSNDCTNFISQAWYAGGHYERKANYVDNGYDGMVYNNNSFWYSERSTFYPSLWSESSSWVNVDDFYTYWSNQGLTGSYYTNAQKSSVIAKAQPGDIIQLSYSSGDKYDRTHSMIVTKKTSSDIYLTYHSGPNNLDIVDKPISSSDFNGRDFWLISFE